MGHISMSRKEREQLKELEQVKKGLISQSEAAKRLGVAERTVRRKLVRYRKEGDIGLVHKNRGKPSPRQWNNEEHKALVIELFEGDWRDFGPTFASKKLKEIYGIIVSRETLRTFLKTKGYWIPKKRKNTYRKRRERKPMRGIMVQCDGSPHDWLEGRAGKCTLLVFIDDATGDILWLEFALSESVRSVMQATKNYIEKHGIPVSFYTDHGSVFHVNLNNQEKDKKTQWERACAELGIKVIHAHSPQAKGRVERCNQTMQDHLIKEMRLAKISSIEDANRFLRESNFIKNHNAEYAKEPAQKGNAHRDYNMHNLTDIFTIQETRILANDFTISYEKRIFQLHKEQKTILRPKNTITVKVSLTGAISLAIRETELSFNEIKSRPIKTLTMEPKPCANIIRKPSENSSRWASGLLPIYDKKEESRVNARLAGGGGNQNENRTFSLCTK